MVTVGLRSAVPYPEQRLRFAGGRTMKRHYATALLLALALCLAAPGEAQGRTEVVGVSGLGCCLDLGVRLSLSLDGATIRGAVAFPGLDARVRSTGSSGAGELFGFAVDTVEIIIWGTPIVRAIAEAALTGLEMRAAAEARI